MFAGWWFPLGGPTADEPPRLSADAEEERASDATLPDSADVPTAEGYYLRTCPGEGPFTLLRRAPESPDRTGDLTEFRVGCLPSPPPGGGTDPYGTWCVTHELTPGEYVLVQGIRSQPIMVDADTGWAALGCEDTCAQSVQVTALDGCSTRGELALTNGLPAPWSVEIAAGTWIDCEPTTLRNLPCTRLSMRVSGGACAPVQRSVDSGDGTKLHAIDLVPARLLSVTVRDAGTDAPVEEARVLGVLGDAALTDAEGRATVPLGAYRFQAAIVLATGYAGHDLLDQDIAWGADGRGTVEVALAPTRPLRVRCNEGDRPCLAETPVSTHRAGQRTRRCTWVGAGVWTCPAADGDVVTARSFARRAQVQVPLGSTDVVVTLARVDRAVCFELPPGEACTAVVSGDGVSARQRVRSGEPVDLGLLTDPLVGLACGAGSWLDAVDPETDDCLRPEFVPSGGLCVPPGRDCSLRAVDPAWDNVVQRPAPCVEGLPPGRYSVACGDAGIEELFVTSGETARAGEEAP